MIGAVIMLVLIVLIGGYRILREHRLEFNEVQALNVAQATLIERHASAILDSTHATLRALGAAVRSHGDPTSGAPLSSILADATRDSTTLSSVTLVDGRGRIIASSDAFNVGLELDLAVAFDGDIPADRLVIGNVQLADSLWGSQLARRWDSGSGFVPIAMRMSRQSGDGPILLGTLRVRDIARFLETARTQRAMRVQLVRADGHVLAASSNAETAAGAWASGTAASREIGSGARAGAFANESIGGHETIGAFRRAPDYPVAATVDLPYESVIGGFLRDRSYELFRPFLVFIVVLAAALLLVRRFRRHEASAHALGLQLDALRERELRYRSAQENSPQGLVSFDEAGRVIDINGAAERLLGFDRAQALGRSAVELMIPVGIRPSFIEAVRQFSDSTQNAQLGTTLQLNVRTAGGVEVPAELTLSQARGRTGLIVTAHLRDLSAEREADVQARVSARRQRAVLDAVGAVIFQLDHDGVLTYLNLAWHRVTRYSIEDSLGRELVDFVVPADRPQLREQLDAIRHEPEDANGGLAPVEVRFVTQEGDERLLSVALRPLRDVASGPVGAVGTLEDVTEQRATEARLREELRFNQELLDAIPLPASYKAVDGTYIAVNRAFEQFFGRPREEMKQLKVADLFGAGALISTVRADEEVVATGRSVSFEDLRTRADGAIRHLWVHKCATRSGDGTVAGIITASIDVTERKGSEIEAQRARDVAEAASRAKSAFLATVSHELRTPLNGIVGMTNLVSDTALSAEQREYLGVIRSSADALICIIDDIHDLTRIEAGELTLARASFDPRALVFEVMRMMAVRAHERGIEVIVDVADDVPAQVIGDPNRLRQVLYNLIANAVRFTEAGEILLEVRRDAMAPGALVFTIRDSGIGMTPELVAFTRRALASSDSFAPRVTGGIGLGLSIVVRLLRLMGGGELDLTSETGKGTAFRFAVPFEVDAAASVQRGPILDHRVLIAARNGAVRRVLAERLERRGAKVTEAASLLDALALVESAESTRSPFEAILLDARLAEEDGLEATRALRAAAPEARLVIMLTLAGPGSERVRLPEDVRANVVRRPIPDAELWGCVQGPPEVRSGSAGGAPSAPAGSSAAERHVVLVAEDHGINQVVVRRLLQKAGYDVEVVANGAEAVEAMESRRFDIVLMDVQMPLMDGIEATRRIREIEAREQRRTPIIALTAHAFGRDRDQCLAAGMDGYLTKPVSARSLAEAMTVHIARGSARAEKLPG